MCQQCLDNLNKYFPDNMPWDKKMDVMWNFTAFPAGGPETIERQLKKYVTDLARQESK